MVVSTPQKPFCDKIEKLALELVKVENERFSLPALKLLLSCVYIGKLILHMHTFPIMNMSEFDCFE